MQGSFFETNPVETVSLETSRISFNLRLIPFCSDSSPARDRCSFIYTVLALP